jgi:Fe-S-cluster containining protein
MGSRVFCLSFHASYRCRHAGACCTSGWEIPVEARLHGRLAEFVRSGAIGVGAPPGGALVERTDLPDGWTAVLGIDGAGRCVFYEPPRGTCAIHRQRGEESLPTPCRVFPRDALIDQRGTFVTLSHYCPTAARLLFEHDGTVRIVAAPAVFSPAGEYEGLEARGALPPLLRPGVLTDLESYAVWEQHMVGTLTSGEPPEASLARLWAGAEAIRSWRPADGTLVDRMTVVTATGSNRGVADTRETDVAALDLDVRRAVPSHLEVPAPVPDFDRVWKTFVAADWTTLRPPVGRYLSARAFASWAAYQGRGLRTVIRSVEAALAVVKMEAARVCARADRAVDAALLLEAFRAADLLLVHLASREDLARRWSEVEDG